jgi:fructose/tagatose bisphosphate aldolase
MDTMSTDDILMLTSFDSDEDMDDGTVGSVIEWKEIDDDYHQSIKERMRETGINLVPILVSHGALWNGHHRVKIAVELGIETMNITDDSQASGYASNLEGALL